VSRDRAISGAHLIKFQQDFYIDRGSELLQQQHGIQAHVLSIMYDIMNNTAQKMVKRQFLGFKDVTKFGTVIDILSYFS